MLLPGLLFSFGGGHRFLCDEEGIEVHGEDADVDFEANLLARGVWARHDFLVLSPSVFRFFCSTTMICL